LGFFRHGGRPGQILLAGAVAACLLAGAPAANALFSRTVNAGPMSVGTFKLASPTGNTVNVTCTPNGQSGKFRMTITVTNHGTVPRATSYVLNVKDSTGLAAAPVTLSPGGTYTAPSPGNKWTYSIDARYSANGTNFWSSDTNPVTAC
jgi:hypothetical protein